MMCTDREDAEELCEIYGLLCWHGHKQDPVGHKMCMWYSIMKKFKCKVSSTWCKEKTGGGFYTQDNMGMRRKGRSHCWITSLGPLKGEMMFASAMTIRHGLRGTIIRYMQEFMKIIRMYL